MHAQAKPGADAPVCFSTSCWPKHAMALAASITWPDSSKSMMCGCEVHDFHVAWGALLVDDMKVSKLASGVSDRWAACPWLVSGDQ